MTKFINHQNPKIRMVIAEIGEKLTSIILKNLKFDNFGEGEIGKFFIEFMFVESD